ncbi:IS1595 family transposase [Lentisphaerota bacterium WC36G]|nr:IS1595 family transposase [Lentisphaerae bacterium WC36]
MSNKYIKRSKISDAKFLEILKYFVYDIEASKIAELTNLSSSSVNKILKAFRLRIVVICEQECIFADGSVELDESCFGACRIRGVRGRGARRKSIVFGMIKRGGKVYTQQLDNCSRQQFYPIISKKIAKNATIYTDSFRIYDGLVDFGYRRHDRVKHGENEFADGHNHINGIGNFWGIAKTRLARFRGISKNTFYLHLKECEFRFNYRHKNIYKFLLKNFRNKPLKLS